ncbi:MAG: FHA domain-containing protein [Phycisphaeraceae bacterium]|nr:MAG: FHA domain-containing protein [Phycisphaeraceae bacterium]
MEVNMPDTDQANKFTLIFFRPGEKKKVDLKPGRFIIGRHSDAQIRVPLPSVSRRHCELRFDGAHLMLRDLGSSNGTYCNNERVDERLLQPGDLVGIGGCRVGVQVNGQPDIPEPHFEEPDLTATPPRGQPAAGTAGSRDSDSSSMMDETVTKGPGLQSLLGSGEGEDSSIFDFDFDFEDDDAPKL